MIEEITKLLAGIEQDRPLVHQITNFVSMNDCANITLAAGASPVMALEAAEVEDMVEKARALVVNLGTLQAQNLTAMLKAARRAKELSIPVTFDPVGAGATRYRTEAAKRFIGEIQPEIVRCNLSEAKVLCGFHTAVKGVDSAADRNGAEEAAAALAELTNGVAAVTGKEDLICDGRRVARIQNGHPLLTRVTGTGCMTTALAACFAAEGDAFTAAAGGVLCMGIAGELAAEALRDKEGPGSFKVRLMDAVYLLNGPLLGLYAKLSLKEDQA